MSFVLSLELRVPRDVESQVKSSRFSVSSRDGQKTLGQRTPAAGVLYVFGTEPRSSTSCGSHACHSSRFLLVRHCCVRKSVLFHLCLLRSRLPWSVEFLFVPRSCIRQPRKNHHDPRRRCTNVLVCLFSSIPRNCALVCGYPLLPERGLNR